MSARTKLNGIYLGGVLAFAALAGITSGSVLVFALTAMAGTAVLLHTGDVRLEKTDFRSAGKPRNRSLR